MIANPCIEVQTSPVDRPSVPAWFAEVVIIARYLEAKGLFDAFAHQVRLVRGRFGKYEPIDFLAALPGYAISGERTLRDFFERVAPFETAFMALFGRKCLPHRSSLSRFLADVDRPCLESFRMLFQQQSFADGWTPESIGGIFDRQGRRYIVFDVDATRQAARQRALPCSPELPPVHRRLDAVCAPGYGGRKRGEVVRTRTTTLQMHTRQWVSTSSGRGNGDTRLGSANHHRLLEVLCFLAGGGSSASGWTIWRRSRHRPDYSGWRVPPNTGERVSTLGASPDPAGSNSFANSKGDEHEHWRGR